MARKSHSNPKLFRELSQPIENADAADAALKAFYEELSALREKHRIRDVYVILAGSYFSSDGEEHEFLTSGCYGDSMKSYGMVAWAFGREQAEYDELIGLMKRAGAKLKA